MRVKLLSELKSTLAGRLFHTLTTRSLKNVDLTRAEQLMLLRLKECPLVLVQWAVAQVPLILAVGVLR